MYINIQWCNDWTIKEKYCTPNIEFMTVGLRPFYLPREFNQLFVMVVYIHPGADVREASQIVADRIHRFESASPDSPKLIVGDFNQCTLENVLPTYEQYVTQPTRNDATLDRCYGNVPRAYKTKACPQLGASDHNNVLLIPSYKQKFKRSKPVTKVRQCWTDDAVDELRACYESTDWNLFFESNNTSDEAVDTISDYIRFCAETIIPVKEQRIYANDKPWVTSSMKKLLRDKREAFASGDRGQLKEAQKRIDGEIKSSKLAYKRKLELNFSQNNAQAAWRAMEMITGYKSKNKTVDFSADFVEELNTFFGRFEVHNFAKENDELKCHLEYLISQLDDSNRICFREEDVRNMLGRVKVNKASGPDGISNRVLKFCHQQLAPLLCKNFPNVLGYW